VCLGGVAPALFFLRSYLRIVVFDIIDSILTDKIMMYLRELNMNSAGISATSQAELQGGSTLVPAGSGNRIGMFLLDDIDCLGVTGIQGATIVSVCRVVSTIDSTSL
jgi:hypothetical protein